jgi:hypothetical protein
MTTFPSTYQPAYQLIPYGKKTKDKQGNEINPWDDYNISKGRYVKMIKEIADQLGSPVELEPLNNADWTSAMKGTSSTNKTNEVVVIRMASRDQNEIDLVIRRDTVYLAGWCTANQELNPSLFSTNGECTYRHFSKRDNPNEPVNPVSTIFTKGQYNIE